MTFEDIGVAKENSQPNLIRLTLGGEEIIWQRQDHVAIALAIHEHDHLNAPKRFGKSVKSLDGTLMLN